VSESHHRPPEGRVVLVRRDDADEIRGEDVSVEKDRAGDCSCQPSTERGLADAGSAGDDQEGWSDEGALVGAMRAPQHVANRWNQVGKDAPASADLTRERHTTIMSPRRPRTHESTTGAAALAVALGGVGRPCCHAGRGLTGPLSRRYRHLGGALIGAIRKPKSSAS
jgi:hypothetical protein